MEVLDQRGSLPSALEVGVGVGVGSGLASGRSAILESLRSDLESRLIARKIRMDLLRMMVDGKVTLDGYYTRLNGFINAMVAVGEASGKPEKSGPLTKKESETQKELPDHQFEEHIRAQVIRRGEIGVTFEDIGALEGPKKLLQRLVLYPLKWPELFKGGLRKPCRGILLFGPPGTGKTMLAKAIANEAGASFINVSMSTITSKSPGEGGKNVQALFTVAAELSPTIIFIDDVDSMLGQRMRVGEDKAVRIIKNEFMSQWDGLKTNHSKHILVLAATSRPFDLDEAAIRRFQRRIMVGLPSKEGREKIFRRLLSKSKTEELDYNKLATMTKGYTGSDLENLCIAAEFQPVIELIEKEINEKEINEAMEKKKAQENDKEEDGGNAESKEEEKEEEVISWRALNMEDMKWAKSKIAASFASQGPVMNELKQWNELYGEGGSRKKQQLSYIV